MNLFTAVINVPSRSDRRDLIAAQAKTLGIDLPFFDAVTPATAPDGAMERFTENGPLGRLGEGDKACTLSHLAAIDAFLASSADVALILEDDAQLATDLPAWLADLSWIPSDADLVKLEAFEQKGLVVLLGKPILERFGRHLSQLLSRHTGGAGYLITRSAAERVLATRNPLRVPIDHMLFNANVSALAADLKSYQVYPALVRQQKTKGGSDLRRPRNAVDEPGWAHVRREIVRGWYEIRCLPRQLGNAVFSGARLKTIVFADHTSV